MTDFSLALFSTDASTVRQAAAAGVDMVVVDWEFRGKPQRQTGADTEINSDTPEDLRRIRAATDATIVCRINQSGDWTAQEAELAMECGADEILLPMVRTPEEIDRTLDVVAGRCGLGILVETQDAVDRVGSLARRPLSRIYVGLNDLRIDRRSDQLFRPLTDGTVDAVRAEVAQPFGVGGLTLPGCGFPVPSDLLAAELVRLRTDFTFLRRSFTADMAGRNPYTEVPRRLGSLAALRSADPADAADDRLRFLAATDAPVALPVGVALPA